MKKFLAMFFAMLILLTGCSKEQPVEVTAQKVQSLDGTLTLQHAGTISLSDETEIRATVSGNIMEKFAPDGSDVTEGQALFKIDELERHTELLQAKAELIQAETDLAKALVAKDSSAEELKLAAEEKRASLKQMEDLAQVGMIYAPKSGRLGSVDVPLGMKVTAEETLLATVGNVNPVAVRFEVSAQEARVLKQSTDLTIRLKLGDGSTYPLNGTLRLAADTAEALFHNPDETLTPGTPAQVEIDGAKLVGVLLVPESAIQRREDGEFVFVVDSDKEAALRKISLGDKIGTYFIVSNGLQANDLVVVEGATDLREGIPLKVN